MIASCLAACWITLATLVAAGDLRVPSQYKTIQAALNAASPYDRVLVAPGTYGERIVFPGFPLLLESEQGAAVTILDGGDTGPVVTFDPRDDYRVILKGFTITGGHILASEARGAGLYCPGASPIIVENVITGNRLMGQKSSYGAGFYCTGNPTVVNNDFVDNMAAGLERSTDVAGGGIYTTGGWFLDNRIVGNTLMGGEEIGGCLSRARGAGALIAGSTVFVQNQVTGNNACFNAREAFGGGLIVEGAAIVLLNLIRNNTARAQYGRGGGIYCWDNARPTVVSNVIVENFAQSDIDHEGQGGGVYVGAGGAPVFAYNTVVNNRVGGYRGSGAGLHASSASPQIVGCLFWDNVYWDENKAQQVVSMSGVASQLVTYSLVGDGQFVGAGFNFRADPLLRDAYHLSGYSPCLDRGEPTNPTMIVPLDVDGASRLLDGLGKGQARIDVGAHEYGALRRRDRHPVSPGHRVGLELAAPALAFKTYLLAASLGAKGIPLAPPDTRVIPLSVDLLFLLSLGQTELPFKDFMGVLDGKGTARPELEVPSGPNMAGVTVHVAGVVIDGVTIPLVINDVSIQIE